MKLTFESTDKIVQLHILGGRCPARIWQGVTKDEILVDAYITRVAVPQGAPAAVHDRFAREPQETPQAITRR